MTDDSTTSPTDLPTVFAVRQQVTQDVLHVYQAVEFAAPPEWSPFLPVPGTYHHPFYGELNYTADTYERIVDHFKTGIYQSSLPVNAEHDPQSSGAVGWITDMRLSDSGAIEVKVDWNDRGRALIEGNRYKYVSAELYPWWTDPVDPERNYQDVAIGMAITTSPYFKESVLPPLVASEAAAFSAGESGKENVTMAEDTQPTKAPVVELTTATEKPEQADPIIRQLDEAAAQEFAELRRNAKRLEEENKQLAADRARLMAESRVKRFTAEVRGASESNGTAYIGDISDHVQMLCDLEESFGSGSQQVRFYMEQNRAHAEQMEKSNIFREMGTSRGTESSTTAYDQIEAMAREVVARTPGTTQAQAFNEVLETNPDLKSALARERRGGQ